MALEEFLNRREIFKELRRTVAGGQKSFVINFDQLLEYDMALAKDLLDNPNDFLSKADGVLEDITKLPGMRLRVRDLDKSIGLGKIRAEHVGKFIQVEGTVSRADELKFIERKGEPEYRAPYKDYQRIRVNGLDVDLTENLVGEANEGNKIIATGTLKAAPTTVPNQFEKLLTANYIVLPDKEECQRKGGVWNGVSCRAGE